MRRFVLIAALSAALGGCAVYHEVPLPKAPNLAQPTGPQSLDLAAAAERALAHSPDLEALRRAAEVSEAQAHETGLLPDPQFSASGDHPTVHVPDLVNGYALGLAQDLQALLTEPSRAEGAKAKQAQARLDLLWAEWQTIQSAANSYVLKLYDDRKVAQLSRTAELLNAQAAHSQDALAAHNATIDVAGSDLSAALDISSQRDTAQRDALSADSDLKAQLALAPATELTLADPGDPAPISKDELTAALAAVAKNRPDLLALQAGYHAQSEAVMTAILQQFPDVNLGFNRAADTSNIQTSGLAVTINIPIFGSTQARIRTERATRAQLLAEYQARLDQTEADAWRIWRALDLIRAQLDRLQSSVPQLSDMAATGQKAYEAGNLPPATYVLMETTLAARASELLDLKAMLWSDTIALRTLLAMTPAVPAVTTPK